ncbi:hypothetical protein BU26DRAFT_522111 [Trematosphaeria pertusa]|uniref:Fumarylacetoacetase n=1 Tax=Trematosphaeria pertusa TaxID=390896 RepID=A0A6A6I5B3_9PLEO|nr:uncharacterized protein BU26DRAFT_522111 [Trematosphaeria pertusa]KAF2245724.1 hypothetical protein BU26DRAFT_522111 [Trematosphaeria pertusa]
MSDTHAAHFSINNIPYGIASSIKRPIPQAVTRIGDNVIFLAELVNKKPFANIDMTALPSILQGSSLNAFAALSKGIHAQVRSAIQATYRSKLHHESAEHIKDVRMHLPVVIGDFTDFSVSAYHVQNAPEALFGVRSLPACWNNFPMGYAGRCSSIYISDTPVSRPLGQYLEDPAAKEKKVIFGPSRSLDYEFELGAIVGRPVAAGTGVYAKDMDEHIFGIVLVNDWSARDIQGCEMRDPLGPLNGKNFATTVSPWVVTLDALRPFEVSAAPHTQPVVDFLEDPKSITYDITFRGEIVRSGVSTEVCRVGFSHMYWTFRQMLAHNSIGGCPLNTGDLLASGTVSGSEKSQLACLMELTMNGKQPATLSDGSALRYLEDGDIVRFTAVAGDASAGVGFGECVGTIKPAPRM